MYVRCHSEVLMNDKRFVLLTSQDNVFICCETVQAGTSIQLNNQSIELKDTIFLGHKIAANQIKQGEKIIRYGAPIGSAKQDISFGEHVHIHNMKSDYIPATLRENSLEKS